ncbi:MAG: fumarylacetoacetate hydrolase family protein [Sulfurospirillaceae bacterium]|nr:fumarylacetoacetate hydrolase family protein [Sulfurospirillaceae bacterium]MDD2825962.1 fumarylacetoacetate hydrolase family protein [Sulfurospirillaceae bacterium]
MRLGTIKVRHEEVAAIITKKGVYPILLINETLKTKWSTTIFDIIQQGQLDEMVAWFTTKGKEELEVLPALSLKNIDFAPLYRHPRKIWGIGLNYKEHASDLHEVAPNTEPASFMKPDTTIIGPKDTIEIPIQSNRTTAEAELGIIIGKACKNIEEADALDVIAGYTTIIDMTAEDILQKNPRYLTRSKSFDTFFSFGPQLVTKDEIIDVLALNVATVINGNLHRENIVANMTFQPWNLVSFHSKVMTLLPGDIISTGTPGAVVIRGGDVVACHIEGFEKLENNVIDLKNNK